MSKIKICGLRRIEDIYLANEFTPDYIGFVFAKSKRQVNADIAGYLKKFLKREIKAVGVFVDSPPGDVIALCRDNIIDAVQLHGSEDGEYINTLRNNTDKEIIKAVRVQNPGQIINADGLDVDYLLLDAYNPKSPGGTGKEFNWDIIPKNLEKPFFLAGGLSEKNLEAAITLVNPYCVDLSSGAEKDGFKDREKIKKVIDITRKTSGKDD